MSIRHSIAQNIEIDRLTDCIVHVESGVEFLTAVVRLKLSDLKGVRKRKGEWQFDWRKEIRIEGRMVYKLTTVADPSIIQGLVSIEAKADHHYLHLVESAPFNFGKNKVYEGVAGNLFAFCCKLSAESGNDGIVAFKSKTLLLEHYRNTLGAQSVGGHTMIIYPEEASYLINKYFNK